MPASPTANHDLAVLRFKQDRFTEAVDLDRMAVSSLRSALGDNNPQLAGIYYLLAGSLVKSGRLDDAHDVINRNIAVLQSHPGHDQDLAGALMVRAFIAQERHHPSDGRSDLEQAIEDRLYGRDDPRVSVPLLDLSRVELGAGALDRARSLAERALAIRIHAKASASELEEVHTLLTKIAAARRKGSWTR